MNKRTLLWLVPAVLYSAFTFWYTDFGGPITSQERSAYLDKLAALGMSADKRDSVAAFMSSDSGRQFLMVNVIDMNDNPPDVAGAEPGESATQLMNRYMEHMYPQLLKRACHPVIMGLAVHRTMDLVGIEGAEEWSMGALFRYRSRRSFMEVITNPNTLGRHEFKVAALNKTIAYPIETQLYPSDLRFLLALILLAFTALLDIALFGRAKATATA